jgi:dihydroxyacetone kinase
LPGFPATFELGEDELEIGLGIHGEKGMGREKVIGADELVEKML